MQNNTNPMFNNNKFKLGIFSINCSGGLAMTTVKGSWLNSWENNLKIAQLADKAGIEFILPAARWLGYEKGSSFHANVLEPTILASALLALTNNIAIFTTVHTSFHHPVVVAKQLTTIDHIGHGRAGLNVVCGWNTIEYEGLGIKFWRQHEERYRYSREWFDIIKNLWWRKEPFDWNGQFFKLKDVYSFPLPLQKKIPILNAAGSNEGKQFAICNADYLFTSMMDIAHLQKNIKELKEQEKLQNRKTPLGLLTFCYVVCRQTRKEAEEYLRYYSQEKADWQAVDKIINLAFNNTHSFPKEQLHSARNRFSAGFGGYPLIGSPDDISKQIVALYNAGLSGAALSFVNYLDEFPYFRDEVLLRLEKQGLRESYKY
ncbi:LLM class flavin-dependent oxidoreductase [Arsenophonus apicola]|uniref:LLM class flavin-dependent oxidoreductase n=1 Tax=Arsenophonus apicola TaxID=2879119 RepID=UPI00387A6444